MNKIKKIFISFSLFFTSMVSRVFALVPKYGIVEDIPVETKYGIFEPTIGEKILNIGRIAIPVIVFIIGLFVIISKKITKKVKAIVISVLSALGIFGILMNYL